MKGITIQELYDLRETIAAELFEGKIFPWEVLPEIGTFLVKLGNTLPEEEYEKKGENIWIARDAKVAPTASITGPCIIGKGAQCLTSAPFPMIQHPSPVPVSSGKVRK